MFQITDKTILLKSSTNVLSVTRTIVNILLLSDLLIKPFKNPILHIVCVKPLNGDSARSPDGPGERVWTGVGSKRS